MQVVNVSRNLTLVQDLQIAATFLTRLQGLLGKKEFPQGYGLLIKPCNWVHTLGMSFPIEVLFLNENLEVIAMERLKPNRFGRPQRSCCALELPWGTIDRSGTILGDKLEIRDF